MICQLWRQEQYKKRSYCGQEQVSYVLVCAADGHNTSCAGLFAECDKIHKSCIHSTEVFEGEAYCSVVNENRDCYGDQDFCDLPPSIQKEVKWV